MALYEAFEEAVGIPFRSWWAGLLKSITGADENTPFESTSIGGFISRHKSFNKINSMFEQYGVENSGIDTFTNDRSNYTKVKKYFPVSFWRAFDYGSNAYAGEITRYLQSKGVVGDGTGDLTYADKAVSSMLFPFRTTHIFGVGKRTPAEVEASKFAAALGNIKTTKPDVSKEELEKFIEGYINNVVATERVQYFLDTGDALDEANKRIANGELGINVYIEMRKDGTITNEQLEAAGYNPAFDIIKLNGIPSTTK